ncbi:MAG: GDP-6-deoxy-D-mannose reductase [Ignavibacteria bacterium]|nr:GDP-6-deoxy-D-mannose reductase [Ignavibacteria bacterium]
MHKYFITGFSGFVGRNFVKYLEDSKLLSSVMGIDIANPEINPKDYDYVSIKFSKSDLKDREKICKLIYDFKPDYIVHLASYSSVAGSWKSPNSSFQNNVNIFVNLMEAILLSGIRCRILSVGSSEVYGKVKVNELPLRECNRLNPSSPFGVARMTQEMLSKLYCEVYNLDIVITRSFNHIGPGQNDNFAISSFAKQLVEVKKNGHKDFIKTGDVYVVRDFIDVRDVVRAYNKLLHNGKKGEIYNVCSGCGVSLQNAIQMMCEILDVQIMIKEDMKLIRPKDNPVIVGSNEKMKTELNWINEYTLEKSLSDVLNYYINYN